MKKYLKLILYCVVIFISTQDAKAQESEITEVDTWLSLGDNAQERDEYKDALKWYKLAAEKGSAKAQQEIGYFFNAGLGVEEDINKAIYWYKLAGENGNASAQLSLGSIYQYGQGVSRDYVKADKWYNLAAAQNNAFALYALGIMYELGYVEENKEKAQECFLRACELGEEDACKKVN